ncbi:PorP/SprF family type IX secretion system membrane protein [Formosa sp. S-31]|uniref:PorP/SprF family type IX secretion system membrane protein n=1 Tax=Formosa sp. S-31 TaxID=2790949 RepID=UPI003EB965E7
MKFKTFRFFLFFILTISFCNAQEGLPIYSDYLTDNYYLIHPSMAGAARCAKVRATGRQQWLGTDSAPQLLTLSYNGRIGESPSALGGILYTDKNGYHSQVGGYATYAHHIMFSRNELDLEMLSFGLSAGAIQYKLDETTFVNGGYDPIISGIEQSTTNFNVDIGASYHYLSTYFHLTVKNLLKNDGVNNDIEITNNLRRYLFSAGSVFRIGWDGLSIEPSVLYQYKEGTKESLFDLNVKMYQQFDVAELFFALSYRRSIDGADYFDGTEIVNEKAQYLSPVLGVHYGQFMFAYTYMYQANSIVFDNGGFHQFTLGFNFNCRKVKYECDCPSVN